ncbi:MAG: hypothetical protein WBH28_11510 [Fuerstiella sp.]
MRLTLRTLLAYLDDRLSPANAKEIGQKIAKSPFATELEERIKSVLRRRRLAKENGEQKTIDANLIAEYLDDQLTPELVALIEKEILTSDSSLAEVAATHQILGLLSDPVELRQSLKDRLYKLAPGQSSEPGQAAAAVATAAGTESEWKPLAAQTGTQKRSPMLLLGVMVLGWLGLLATDSHLFHGPTADTDDPSEVDVAMAPLDAADGAGNKPAITSPNALTDAAAADSSANNAATNTELIAANQPAANPAGTNPAGTNDTPPAAAQNLNTSPTVENAANALNGKSATASPAAVANTSPTVASSDSSSGNVAMAATDATTTESPAAASVDNDAVNSNTPAAAIQPLTFHVEDPNNMVVLGDLEKETWSWAISADTPAVHTWNQRLKDTVAGIAVPFEAQVSVHELGWSAKVLGSSLFATVHSANPGLALLQGQVLVKHVGRPMPNVGVRMHFGEQSIVVHLPDDGGYAAVQYVTSPVQRSESDDFELLPDPERGTVTVYAPEVGVAVSVGTSDEKIVVPRGSHFRWRPDAGDAPVVNNMPPVPAWVFEAAEPKPETASALIAETAAEFRKSLTVADAGTEVIENLNPQIAAYGVQLPMLLRNVDDLTATLLESDVTKVRNEAIMGLTAIVVQNVGGRKSVVESLQTRLPEAEVDNVIRLLEGIAPASAEDVSTSAWLVGMLSNNRPAVRELAIFNLERLTGERFNFFADDDASRRDSAIRRWTKLLERNDGRLKVPSN